MSTLLKRYIYQSGAVEKYYKLSKVSRMTSWEKIAQLSEQANQSCPPLKVSSDIVANDPRMVPGYTNLGDYLPDDVHYDFLEVDEHR